MIVGRADHNSVLTRTGNMYVLKGPIDEGKMRHQEFSEKVIEAFHDGFPENWDALLDEHFAYVSMFMCVCVCVCV